VEVAVHKHRRKKISSNIFDMFGVSPTPTPPLTVDATNVVIDSKDLINGFSAEEIFSSADCQGIISYLQAYSSSVY